MPNLDQKDGADDRPTHVKHFLASSPNWDAKLRRRTAILLGLLNEKLGRAAADLLLSDPAWAEHILAGHDDIMMTTSFTAAIMKALADEGKIDPEAAAVLGEWNRLVEPEEDVEVKEYLWGLAMETAPWPKERQKKLQEVVARVEKKADPMLAFLVEHPDELEHVFVDDGAVRCHGNMVLPFGRWLLERGLTTQEKFDEMVQVLGGGAAGF